ncbi:MAG: hypothetical protein JNL19_14165 [Burkholderiales bacterium]|nr:hypothetical protein [Burkholderiales bacterium]
MKPGLALFAAAFLACAPSYAASGKGFASADANRDRVLTRAEACSGKARLLCRDFDAIDANRNGVLTRAELKAYRNAKRIAKGMPPKR